MMLFYSDKFLATLVTEEIELRATEDVAVLGSFDTDSTERMVVCRAYVIACIENVKSSDDIFNTKAKLYQRELDMLLKNAKSKTASITGWSPFYIPIERA